METAAGKIFDNLVEPAKMAVVTTIKYAISCNDNLHSLERQVKKLQSKVKDEKQKLKEAEREDQTATCEFENWENDAKKLEDYTKERWDEFQSMSTCIGACNVASRSVLSWKAERMTVLATELYDNIPQISHNIDPDRFVERLCICMVGRDSVLQQLQQLALDDTKNIIGVHGMAGVGKTELLNCFYNEFHKTNSDHRMIWVDMKDCHSVEDTQKAISRRLVLRWNDTDKQEVRASRILWNLNKKSFILILDDVWSAMDLKDVGIPIPTEQAKSKVILATRREDVCDTMEATKLEVKCLDSDEAWSLFIEKTGKELVESEPEIRHQAEIFVKKCGGLPLALVTIGRAMARKRTPDLWKHAVTTLENTPKQIRGMDAVLSCLWRSYDNLNDDKLETCLLYCTLFPEYYDIYKQNIVDYCIGEGVLVDRFYDGDHVYNEGYNLLDVLKSASMLESGSNSNYIKMHPMMRVLALSIESGVGETKCLIRAGKGLAEAPEVDEWSGVERISLMHNNIETLLEMPNSPSLLTLLLNYNPIVKICKGFFQSMTNLRVLDLSNSLIQEVPAEIGELVQLQYLDFCNTKIASLPEELGNLVSLRYFLLSYTPNLKSIPEGLIRKLSKLRVLYMHASYEKWKAVESVGEGVDFEELHLLKRLKTLGITVNSAAVLKKLAGSYRLASCTSKLEIKLCPGLKSTLSTTNIGSNFKALKMLRLSKCSDLEELSIDGLSTLQNLTDLVLFELPRANITWNGGRLQNLRCLTISGCRNMRQLIHCDEEFNEEEEEDERLREINVVPNLYQLDLFNLPELESLSCGSRPLVFRSLEVLRVVNCPTLRKLPLNAEKLKSLYSPTSWWDALEWPEDHDHIKSKFLSIFKDIYEKDTLVERASGLAENDSVFEQLQQLAFDDRVSIIGIYGMAGVGKTRLLEKFFHQFHLREGYKMMWIDMNGSHNVQETQKAVAEKLGLAGYQSKGMEELALRIRQFLNKRNFILILDNVWEVVDLNGVGIPTATCQAKHKIILATRIQDICDSMNATKVHVKCLEWEEAWNLFVKKAGAELIKSDPVIRQHAKSMVIKCGGLPLALVPIGRAMAKKRDPLEWKHAVQVLGITPLQIQGMRDVLSCMKLSYDNLADDKLRTCLLYCSMFGANYNIHEEVLTSYWIGEGVLADDSCDGTHLYNEGHKVLDVIKGASLVETGSIPDYIKVHPMICALALWIHGDKWLIRAGGGLIVAPANKLWKGVERVSLVSNNIRRLSGRPHSPSLLTLLLSKNPLVKIGLGFFKNMKNLRVLDLSYTSIPEVPAEIGELIQLRCLNLSGTKITSLPRELANLIRLRFLGLQDTPSLVIIPQGLIASLTDLRVLATCNSYKDWKVDSNGDGIDFEELQCLKLLRVLGISVNTTAALQKLAGSPQVANSTHRLEISLSDGLTTLSAARLGSEFKALKFLRLHQCNDMEELAIDARGNVGSSTLPNLADLELIELPSAKITWNGGCFQNLRILTIMDCGEMRQLIHCDDESIEKDDVLEEINVLPNLYQLDLIVLPQLESLSCGSRPLAFPCLAVLKVKGCPKLKKLPLNADGLMSIHGQLSWWNGLKWKEEHDNIKSRFKSIFVNEYR